MRRRVLKTHLPWYWEPHTACWSCEVQEAQAGSLAHRQTMEHGIAGTVFEEDHMHLWCQLMLGSLHQIRSWLECSTLDDLLDYILQRELYTFVKNQFSSQEHQLLTFWADSYCPSSVPTYICNPPNHPICIFNWELIAVLLSRVGEVKQERFLLQKQRLTYEGANITEPISQSEEQLVFVDSHFHLDQILRRMRLRNFQHLQSVVAPGCSQYFYYGVANYVFPSRWNNWDSDVGFSRGVYVSFGIHPHLAAEGVSKRQMDQLDSLTDSHLCVAIGEVGLDYTTTYDILVFSKTFEEHLNHQLIFDKLISAGLTLKPGKCLFARKEVIHLGHTISKEGVKADTSKVDAEEKMGMQIASQEDTTLLLKSSSEPEDVIPSVNLNSISPQEDSQPLQVTFIYTPTNSSIPSDMAVSSENTDDLVIETNSGATQRLS
ncbi:unnamed protein product [Mytilus coruscus]|uniref:TatD n=1 Tax=Mytilus coruscus TaxID=42192 RepID=A0A6J8AKS6_MYTCO|nr:unnamed protein product [Mytilus coruscus]